MARDYAQIRLSIWDDDAFRGLSANAQHLYMVLLTSAKLDYCGVTDWRPGRIAALASDWTAADVENAAAELSKHLYVMVDVETEEVLLRSFIRNDGFMSQPNLGVSMMRALAGIASTALRQIIVHELKRLHDDHPDLKGWNGADGGVRKLTERPSLDPQDYPSFYPSLNPSIDPKPNPSVDPSPTTAPAPTPATAPQNEDSGKNKRATTPREPEKFDRFWSAYPLKKSKLGAIRRWNDLLAVGHDPDEIIAGAKAYAIEKRGSDPKFMKHPDGWLNTGRWEDQPTVVTTSSSWSEDPYAPTPIWEA